MKPSLAIRLSKQMKLQRFNVAIKNKLLTDE